MAFFSSRLGVRLIGTSIAFLAIVALVTGLLVQRGFNQTQRTATNSSIEGLTNESRQKLLAVTQNEALLATAQFQEATDLITLARTQLLTSEQLATTVQVTATGPLAQTETGVTFDPEAARLSDVWIPVYVPVTPALNREVRASAILDTLMPGILEQYPAAAAVAFTAAAGWARYYPPIGLHEIVPPDFAITQEAFFTVAAPANNPQRNAVWTSPYSDPAGQGLLTSVGVPVYRGETFAGVMSMDVSLNRIIERLQAIKSTPSSAALLLDSTGRLVAASPAALAALTRPLTATDALTATSTLPTQSVTQALGLNLGDTTTGQALLTVIKPGQSGIERIARGDDDLFLSYASVPNVGWTLAVMTPVSDLTGEAQTVSAAIQQGTSTTIRQTLLALAGLVLVAVAVITLLSRRLTRPLVDLAQAVDRVAQGDLQQTIAVTNTDEIGDLQRAFGHMVADLGAQRTTLEQRNTQLQSTLDRQEQLFATIQELSTPLLPVLDDVLVLPLVGHIDTHRAQDVMDTLLKGVYERRARIVIVDITGVPVVDAQVLDLILKAAQGVELLGAQVILAGISSEMAQFIAREGIVLGKIQTRQNLHMAIQAVLTTHRGTATNGGSAAPRR